MNNYSFYKGGKAFYCLFFFGCFLSFTPVLATSMLRQLQSNTPQNILHGIITDGTSPLPGVTISLKGKTRSGTISDYNGQYSITASSLDTLMVSFIGFKTAIIPVKGQQTLDIVLQSNTTELQEVRVNAGYYSVKESERTGNISRITSKDIQTQPVTNVLATMQGRMAGVEVTQTTGVPGGGFEIKIRGQNSIRPEANNPLYIIDGVPYASDPIGSIQTSTIYPTFNSSPLNSINPDAIESIEVLKDADATAIYGSRGANGVVLITTKKGKEGKTSFTLNASSGAGSVTRFMKLMNTSQYLEMRRQAFINDGRTKYPKRDYDINGTWDQNRYTDWQEELIGGTAAITDLQGTLSGGSQNTQFLLSGNYHTESTVFPGDFLYKKGGSQFNLNHQSTDNKFQLVFSAGYTVQNNNQPANDFTYDSRTLVPNAPALYDSKGNLNWEKGTWNNPLAMLSAQYVSKTKDLLANGVLSYQILPNLKLKGSFGYTDLQNSESRINPSTIYNPSIGRTSAISTIALNTTKRSSWIIEPQINWEKEFGGGRLGILFGGSFQEQNTSRLFQSGTGFSSNSLIYDLASATYQQVLVSDETLYRYQAFFGRVNYNYMDRYILNLTARRDGSSRFGPGNQFANFGAAGLAWVFSNEHFLSDSSWLSFGKLRGSYGSTGSDQIGDYQFLDTYNSSGVSYDNIIGLQPSRLFNPNFGWEVNKKLEAALELGFLADRIFITAAWYQNRSSNQLVGIPLPGTTGFPLIQANLAATVQNTGWEFTLRTVNFSSKDFNWTSSINLSLSRNELLSFPNLGSSTYANKYRIGEPLNIQLRYHYTGLDPVLGIYQFEDQNKDGKISSPDDRLTVINLNPDYFGGFQNQLRYKNWKLDFLFQFVKQRNQSFDNGLAGYMTNQPERLMGSWQQPGDPGPYQIYSAGYNLGAVMAYSRYGLSDATIVDASYIRLKNMAVSYDVPLHLKEVKCAVSIQGQNLLTFSPYKDGDPEFTNPGYLPPLKIITGGIQLTF
ncbi:SusC/RagA family TonB-linked outer membrane protein [Flavobacterium sp. Root420]|uniref:SusC/RagA family TonB-linked outer membrane protein n=1 Tax=Flavobacterium sp. Root420 TaxID=1736533 RepID=UPI0006FBFF2D|nr:SusC/RagA family TonB-linked outer membrane protein [Flavobacterium sp. Root420]KQW99406.1 SusC/RagA family TonB-linked outer membrane protein [Flavobacterium sp. Root420]